ncbi:MULTISPECIES: uracil-DNA glycosylase [unclassified Streptomyces]|uniref:uracil-DNA glycosylase n=1 Tax=unclassified Streptomyces TaxID=2593676 RepID=UPI00159F1628|nr:MULTISPECIES: uracil-DNA glycosylase [unclassified Streptomyces]
MGSARDARGAVGRDIGPVTGTDAAGAGGQDADPEADTDTDADGTARFLRLLRALPAPPDAEALYGPGGAGPLRRRNLLRYLDLMREVGPKVLLVAEAPGYRGTTVTGVPFMSVRQLTAKPGLITGRPEGDGFEAPDRPAFDREASSAAVWGALASWQGRKPLLWGIYPHHPHAPGDPHTNRTPRASEIAAGAPIALALAAAFGITSLVAVGRKAQGALAAGGLTAPAIRHPAQGGARIFAAQLAALNAEQERREEPGPQQREQRPERGEQGEQRPEG